MSKQYKCPFAGKLEKVKNMHNPKGFNYMMECTACLNEHVTHETVSLESNLFGCLATDYKDCVNYKSHFKPKADHSCFEHDYDGGVCMVCGSGNHREELRDVFGWDGDERDE